MHTKMGDWQAIGRQAGSRGIMERARQEARLLRSRLCSLPAPAADSSQPCERGQVGAAPTPTHVISANTTVEAAVRVRPVPAALMDRMATR